MPGENLPRRVWNRQTKFTYNHWLAALVKGKCTSTKPTRLATGVVCTDFKTALFKYYVMHYVTHMFIEMQSL